MTALLDLYDRLPTCLWASGIVFGSVAAMFATASAFVLAVRWIVA